MAPENLEKKIKEIEEIVENLKEDSIDLDKSIEMYERGIKLIKECETLLSVYEEKIKKISEGDKKSE